MNMVFFKNDILLMISLN